MSYIYIYIYDISSLRVNIHKLLHGSGLISSSPGVHSCIKQLLVLIIISNMWNGRNLINVWFIEAKMWTVNRVGSRFQCSQYG